MTTHDSNLAPSTDPVSTPADDAVQGYGDLLSLIPSIIGNLGIALEPHAATPVPLATGGGTVGTPGGPGTTNRMS